MTVLTAPTSPLATVRRCVVLLVALLISSLALGLGSAAQAVSYYGASGQPGGVTPYRVVGATLNTCAPVGTCYQRQVRVPGPTVGRSPNGNASQSLRVQYRIYRWTGSAWAAYQTVNRTYSIGYAGSIRLQQENFNNFGGYFTVQMSMSWHLSSTGMTLGTRSINFDGDDYSCSAVLACSTSAGWVYLG